MSALILGILLAVGDPDGPGGWIAGAGALTVAIALSARHVDDDRR